jgi:hypothetical protein
LRLLRPHWTISATVSVIVTPMFNTTGRSILLPALFHFRLVNPLWPGAQPNDIDVFVAVALMVVWFHRESMFTRDGAVTELMPDE